MKEILQLKENIGAVTKAKELYSKYDDAGHGWLKVKKAELKELRISDKISRCSYQRGKFAYLEEDCDLSVFIEAKEKTGVKVEVEFFSTDDSPIRNYEEYQN